MVVVRDGKVIAERYADGIGIDTPLLGFSMTKSVVSALLGILTLQGRICAVAAGAGSGMAGRDRSAPRDRGRASAAHDHRPRAR